MPDLSAIRSLFPGGGGTGELPMEALESLRSPAKLKALYEALSTAAATGGKAVMSRGKSLASAARINRIIKALPRGLGVPSSRAAWALAPLGLGAGYLADKYLKGDY